MFDVHVLGFIMIDLDKILKEWQKDAPIDILGLDDASRRTPVLHGKYLGFLSRAKLEMKDAEFKQKELMRKKFLWYNGKMTQAQLEREDWDPDPFDGLKIMKGDMHYYVESDPELIKSEAKIHYHKTVIDTLKEIVDTIKWRHMVIKNIIENKKFEAGF